MEGIYQRDPTIIEIECFISDIARKLDALSEIAWANINMRGIVRL